VYWAKILLITRILIRPVDRPNIAPFGAPLFEENPHGRQNS